MMLYEATYEFVVPEHRYEARSSCIHFYANGKKEAVDAFGRFWLQRFNAIPEWYGRLLAVTIYPFEPKPIDDDGTFHACTFMPAYEWKIDRGPYGAGI